MEMLEPNCATTIAQYPKNSGGQIRSGNVRHLVSPAFAKAADGQPHLYHSDHGLMKAGFKLKSQLAAPQRSCSSSGTIVVPFSSNGASVDHCGQTPEALRYLPLAVAQLLESTTDLWTEVSCSDDFALVANTEVKQRGTCEAGAQSSSTMRSEDRPPAVEPVQVYGLPKTPEKPVNPAPHHRALAADAANRSDAGCAAVSPARAEELARQRLREPRSWPGAEATQAWPIPSFPPAAKRDFSSTIATFLQQEKENYPAAAKVDFDLDSVCSEASDADDPSVVIVGPTEHAVMPLQFSEVRLPEMGTRNGVLMPLRSGPGKLAFSDIRRLSGHRPEAPLSFGTALHLMHGPTGACRPCMFERWPGRCIKGSLCDFCHLHMRRDPVSKATLSNGSCRSGGGRRRGRGPFSHW